VTNTVNRPLLLQIKCQQKLCSGDAEFPQNEAIRYQAGLAHRKRRGQMSTNVSAYDSLQATDRQIHCQTPVLDPDQDSFLPYFNAPAPLPSYLDDIKINVHSISTGVQQWHSGL
jgi:hypothetical protein